MHMHIACSKPQDTSRVSIHVLLLLCRWRELNAAAGWLAAERQLRPLAQSLPLLLHHKQQV
jgi:hypothetical protein